MFETSVREARSRPDLAFVIDDDVEIRECVSIILAGLGMTVAGYEIAADALAGMDGGHPAIVFLDVALLSSDAIDVIHGLKERGYRGVVHLMSGGRPWLLEAVARLARREGIILATPLQKPVVRAAIVRAVEGLADLVPNTRPDGR